VRIKIMGNVKKWPLAKTPSINKVISLLKKRNKTLKHRARSMVLNISVDDEDGIIYEKLTIEIELWVNPKRKIIVDVWQDCAFAVDVREASKNGWVFEFTINGFDEICVNIGFIDKIEQTIAITSSKNLTQETTDRLIECWKKQE